MAVCYFTTEVFFWGSPTNNLLILWHTVWKQRAMINWWKYNNERTVQLFLWLIACVCYWADLGTNPVSNTYQLHDFEKVTQTRWALVSSFIKWSALIRTALAPRNKKICQSYLRVYFSDLINPQMRHSGTVKLFVNVVWSRAVLLCHP